MLLFILKNTVRLITYVIILHWSKYLTNFYCIFIITQIYYIGYVINDIITSKKLLYNTLQVTSVK